ncbi:PREDICTED: LOW QUALITY PROTEIN: golgin subfamily A member 8R-like [Camelina sativa]|uniref:LOW QUALITY PROTEIN: golgin subfamily A member 8R-like n=1 Tax=Camelina sativa TaxID=90675 RepID=A0ABM0T0E5_CAMSA|nr:PREDICTED: LOW QUALITY PROTEIN: golgin subfamily A member 8R-like [Camelina sativa]
MEENKKLRVTKLKKERLRKSLLKAKSQASDILSFTQSWRDLETHFASIESDLVKRSQEIDSREENLEKWSHVLKSKAKLLEKSAREIASADGFRRLVEENQKKLDRLKREIETEEKKRLQLQKLNHDRKIELKWTREQVDALQKHEMKRDVVHFKEKSYEEMSEEQQDKYEEILKKHKSVEKKLRDCTRDLAQKEGELRWVSMRLTKRCVELEWEKRKINLEKSNMIMLRKLNEEAERKLQHLNRALEEKQKEVDSIEKIFGERRNVKGRGNSDTSGDESSLKRANM